MKLYPKNIASCFIASLVLLSSALVSAEEKERIVTQQFAVEMIDFVHDKEPGLTDSSNNTLVLVVLQEVVNQYYQVNEDDVNACKGLSDVNAMLIRYRQGGLAKERAWENIQSYISSLEVFQSDLDYTIPSEPESRILLNYVYAESLDNSGSSQKEQYIYLSGRFYESCIRQ